MMTLVNTDANIQLSEGQRDQIIADVDAGLARFAEHLTRVELHFSDQSAGRVSGDDIVCLLEIRPSGRNPQSVTHDAPTAEEALRGALRKAQRVLDGSFGRLDTRKGGKSMGGIEPS